MVPPIRIRALKDLPPRLGGQYVLYWLSANRRLNWNFSLDRALEWSRQLGKPLVCFEALRLGYRWASDRLHQFMLEGMADNRAWAAERGATYYPYVETEMDAGKGLIEALGRHAAVVVTDDFPCFFLPRMLAAAAKQLDVRFEAVDSNGLLPMRAADTVYPSAYAFRRFLQKSLAPHLASLPVADPLRSLAPVQTDPVPREIHKRWPFAAPELLTGGADRLARLGIDHSVKPAPTRGGVGAARRALEVFLDQRLGRYAESRNQPEEEVASGMSPYLHFGHLSAHEVFAALARREQWTRAKLSGKATGSRNGWWGMSGPAEAFLDELVTWRELGYNFCWRRADHDQYASLPDWARQTLAAHADDPRPSLYRLEEFEAAQTHDPLWNAAQTQLVREGRIHNYLRMLWGKKILHWSAAPQEAAEIMIELNNKYALDGRNPNSYSGIFWCLGRYDRPWGPERPIFGKIRYMTSENTARKIRVDHYIARYAP